ILAEDRQLELPERRPGLDAEIVDEGRARRLERRERVRLPARAVEREHQLPAQTLAQRMLLDELIELWNELAITAEGEVRLDPSLECADAQLLQPRDRRLRERLVRQFGNRRPAPEAERLAEQRRGVRGLRVLGLRQQLLEAVDVQLAPPDLEHVARR